MTTTRGAMLGFFTGLTFALLASCGPKVACDAASCALGCCDAEGICQPGTTELACGVGARACVACQGSQRCDVGSCTSTGGGTGADAGTGGGDGGSAPSAVVINEVAASDGDFFELMNTGSTPVDLSGYQVADRDDVTMGPKLATAVTLPAGTQLAPGALLLFTEGVTAGPSTTCLEATVATCFNFTFGLSANNGDAVFLVDAAGAVKAQLVVPAMAHGPMLSWGRLPNGTGAFVETARTPGAANHAPAVVDAGVADAGLLGTFAVVRVGPAADGGSLSNASAPVRLEWRDLATGAVLRTATLPTVDTGAQHAFALSGSASSDGLLASSGGYWTIAGYGAAPGVATVNSVAGVSRVVARIGDDGGIDTSTAVTDAYPGNNFRAAATADGTRFWLAGTAAMNAGVRTAALGSVTSTDVLSTPVTNVRAVKVMGGQLYASTATDAGAGVPRVFAVGQGLPASTTAQLSPLTGVTLLTAGDFVLLDLGATGAPDTLYVADTTNGAGVHRYTLSGGTWRETSQLRVPATAACTSVAARAEGAGPVTVLCSASDGTVYRWADEGFLPDGGATTGAAFLTAPAGTAFRGLGF